MSDYFTVAVFDDGKDYLLSTPNVAGYGNAIYLAHAYAKLPISKFSKRPRLVTVCPMQETINGCLASGEPLYIELHVSVVAEMIYRGA